MLGHEISDKATIQKFHATPVVQSDVGRKRFGFSHEDIENSNAYYEGQFRLYQRNGEGTLHGPETGLTYVGQFQNDQFHGKGRHTWPDGGSYSGQWRDSQKHGDGIYISPEGLAYEGQWESNKRHGQGSQEYANGDRYDGWWYRGLCSGLGTYYFNDGSRYEGAWANGRYDGNGILYGADGSRERQAYSGGLLKKREVLKPVAATTRSSRRDWNADKALVSQARNEVQKPVVVPIPQPSRYLIQRETAGMDLSAPPLLPRCHPAPLCESHPAEMDNQQPLPIVQRKGPMLAETLFQKYFAEITQHPLAVPDGADPDVEVSG